MKTANPRDPGTPDRFDPGEFERGIERILVTGNSAQADEACRKALAAHPGMRPSRPWIIVAQTCLRMGRTKQVRHWLEKLAEEAAPEEVVTVIGLAVRARQAQLALRLYGKLDYDALPPAEHCLATALDTLDLARLLRLPQGRHGAWAVHRELLAAADRLLTTSLPALASDEARDQAKAGLVQARALLGGGPVSRKPAAPASGERDASC